PFDHHEIATLNRRVNDGPRHGFCPGWGHLLVCNRGLHLMTLGSRKAMLLLCAAAIAGFSGAASARPLHHHRHHSHHRAVQISTAAAAATVTNSDTNQRLQFQPQTQAMAMAPATGERQYSRRAARVGVAEPAASASLLGGL